MYKKLRLIVHSDKKKLLHGKSGNNITKHTVTLPVKMASINSNDNPSGCHQFAFKKERPNVIWVNYANILSKTTQLFKKTLVLIPKTSPSNILWMDCCFIPPHSFNRSSILTVLHNIFYLQPAKGGII